jgi:hypothetical protein
VSQDDQQYYSPSTGQDRGEVIADSPLTPDQLLLKDNIPASSPMPGWIEEQMSERIVYISSREPDADASQFLESIDVEDGTAKLRLPPGSFLGRLGKSSGTTEIAGGAAEAGGGDTSKPFRPEWQDYVYHPKLTVEPPQPSLRRKDGRRVRPHTVYQPDNRTVFFPSGYPMRCVGRLFIWDNPSTTLPQRSGSAALVGTRVILTAAHLMPRDGRPGRWGARFVPGYFDGASTSGVSSFCEGYRVPPQVEPGGFDPGDARQAFDLAVMKLYDPLGAALGWLGARKYDSDWEDEHRWTLVGYPGDPHLARAERPSLQNGIAVIDDDPDGRFSEIEHRGDATEGNSGGPLFGTFPDGPYIIGVHGGFEFRTVGPIVAEDNNVAAGGQGMADIVLRARAEWP